MAGWRPPTAGTVTTPPYETLTPVILQDWLATLGKGITTLTGAEGRAMMACADRQLTQGAGMCPKEHTPASGIGLTCTSCKPHRLPER